MRKVESQIIRCYKRTFLFDMCTENRAKRLMEQVSSRVVSCCSSAQIAIYFSDEDSFRILGKRLRKVYNKIVFFLGVEYFNRFFVVRQRSLVAYLSTAFRIEWRMIEDNLVNFSVFLGIDQTITHNPDFIHQ